MNEPLLADQALDEGDEAILAELAALYERIDPVPFDLTERIGFAIAVAELEAEIAELSLAEPVGMRGEETDSVTFTSGSLSVMITTVVSGRRVRVDGWVTSPDAAVDAVAEGVTRSALADAQGRFSIDDLPRGRAHFVIRREGLRPVLTPPIEI